LPGLRARRTHQTGASQELERAARDDVLFVRHAAGASSREICAAVSAAHRAAGSPQLRSALLWQAGVADDGSNGRDDDDGGALEPGALATAAHQPRASTAPRAPHLLALTRLRHAEAEEAAQTARAAHRKASKHCRRVVKGVAPLLAPTARLHVLTPGLLPAEGPPHLAEDEAELAGELEAAAAGRPLLLGRGAPLGDGCNLLSSDGEAVCVDAAYFDVKRLKQWRFARNRHVSVSLTGIDPHRRKVAGVEDAGDVQQAAITYLKEIPVRCVGG